MWVERYWVGIVCLYKIQEGKYHHCLSWEGNQTESQQYICGYKQIHCPQLYELEEGVGLSGGYTYVQ